MAAKRYRKFRILRYKPEVIDPPRFQTYPVREGRGHAETVLDGLEQIRLNHDPTLLYRHSCHHSSCGTCACRINGHPRLACTTRLAQIPDDPVVLEPLGGLACVGDLVVDMGPFFRDIDPEWAYQKAEPPDAGEGPQGIRLEDCIECACCLSACPVSRKEPEFMGPAALAALHVEMEKTPEAGKGLLDKAGSRKGEPLCSRALACSRVCPTGVYPALHIHRLRQLRKRRG